jgi:hypothetical protein
MDNTPTDYVWRAKKNKSFIARCHIETGNTRLQFRFASDLGPIERPHDIPGNPLLIVSDNGNRVALRGAATIASSDTQEMGTITFTPEEEGFTSWHWTLTRDGKSYSEEGQGIFLRGEPKPAKRVRKPKALARKKVAAVKKTKKPVRKKAKAVTRKKPAARKTARAKTTRKVRRGR